MWRGWRGCRGRRQNWQFIRQSRINEGCRSGCVVDEEHFSIAVKLRLPSRCQIPIFGGEDVEQGDEVAVVLVPLEGGCVATYPERDGPFCTLKTFERGTI